MAEKTTRRGYVKYAAAGVVVIAVAGAGGYYATRPRAPEAVTLRGIAPKGPRFSIAIERMVPYFKEENPHIDIIVEPVPWATFFEKVNLEMVGQTGTYDWVHYDEETMEPHAATDRLLPLDDYIDALPSNWDLDDIPKSVRDLYVWEGVSYGFPNDCNCQIFYYRKDVFEDQGIEVPQTWDEVMEVAKQLTNPDKGEYGYVGGLMRGSFLAGYWYGMLWAWGGECFDEDMNPTLNSSEAKEATEFLKKLTDYAPPGVHSMVEDEVYASIANIGESMMAPQEWGGSAATSKEFSALADKIGTTLTPKGPIGHRTPVTAGLGMQIFKSAPHPDESWQFIEFLCRKENMKKYVEASGQPARISALTDPELVEIAPYFPALGANLAIALGRPPIPEFIEFDTMIAEEISNAITGVKQVDTALNDLNDRVRELLDKAGYYTKGTKKWFSESPMPGSDR